MTGRAPFVSGLPGGADLAPPAGIARLDEIRALAKREIEQLAPLTRERFDGVERHPVDTDAVAASATYEAIVALIDGIAADAVLRLRIAALLTRRRPA